MNTKLDIKIGKLLRQQRHLRGATQTEMGNACGITYQQVQKYERGLNRIPASNLKHMVEFLGMGLTEFFILFEGGESEELSPISKTEIVQIRAFLSLDKKARKGLLMAASALSN